VNGLSGTLLTSNPNGANPRRLNPAVTSDVLTCDQDHDYGPEQAAFDSGKMDKFLTAVATTSGTGPTGAACKASDVMNYYDGNTVTAKTGLSEIGHDTQSFVNGVPQFNTPNHQYDMSDFDQLVAAISNHQLPASALPAVSLSL
jgi:phospholipase C